MTTFAFANNVNTELASSISSSDTTITLSSGANLPTIPAGYFMAITLNDAATQQIFEIVYATAVSGTTLTVVRAQEGTTAHAWAAGDYVFSGPTAGQMEELQDGIGAGVSSWNARTGAVNPQTGDYTWSQIGGTFPFVQSFNDRVGSVVLSGTDVATALGYTPADDADVVHLAGAETITGAKTFSESVIAQGLLQGNQISAVGTTCGLVWHDRSGTNFWQWYSDGGNAAMYNSVTGTSSASIDAFSSAWTFPNAITCVTMNASGSDRRLKRDIKKFEPRPLHRTVPFVSYTLKENGWRGLGAVAQSMRKIAPEHVGEFDWHGKRRLNLNYAGAAYEQAIWAGRELDRQAKLIASLEKRLAKLETCK